MFTLKTGFENLLRSKIEYVVISDFTKLPSAIPEAPLEILTTPAQHDDLIALMGLFRRGHPEQYSLPDNAGLTVQVYQKSKHVFPDVFEAGLLQGSTLHNQCVKIPGQRYHGMMVLYRQLFHYGAYKDQQWVRGPLMELAKQQTGTPMRTKYKTLSFTP